MSISGRISLLALCFLCLGASLALFQREYWAAFFLRGTMNDQIESISSPSPPPVATSARTIRDMLTACGRILTTAPRLKAEPETAQAVRAGCARLSAAVLDDAPGNARARAVGLLSALPEISADQLASAQMRAPYEPWPLLMRIESVALAPAGRADLAAVAESDFIRAMSTPWGRDRLARLYVERPDLRDTITRAGEQAAPEDQQAFPAAVRRALAGDR